MKYCSMSFSTGKCYLDLSQISVENPDLGWLKNVRNTCDVTLSE